MAPWWGRLIPEVKGRRRDFEAILARINSFREINLKCLSIFARIPELSLTFELNFATTCPVFTWGNVRH
jgi:hypothetical protein